MTSRRRFLTVLSLAGACALLPSHPLRAEDGGAFVSRLAEQAIATTANKSLSDAQRADNFRRLFVSSFDLQEIGRFVLGRYWRIATPEQQKEFLHIFEEISTLTWTRRFKDYSGETLNVRNSISEDSRVSVESRINRTNGAPPINVTWKLKSEGGNFKVVDIVVEGVSMAITHRSEYSAALQQSGGKLDGLLDVMRKKLAQLQG